MTITEFLLARIAEDEAVAIAYRDGDWWGNPYSGDGDGSDVAWADRITPARVLAECAAKREIVERLHLYAAWGPLDSYTGHDASLVDVLRILASVYADHPDFNPDWT